MKVQIQVRAVLFVGYCNQQMQQPHFVGSETATATETETETPTPTPTIFVRIKLAQVTHVPEIMSIESVLPSVPPCSCLHATSL